MLLRYSPHPDTCAVPASTPPRRHDRPEHYDGVLLTVVLYYTLNKNMVQYYYNTVTIAMT